MSTVEMLPDNSVMQETVPTPVEHDSRYWSFICKVMDAASVLLPSEPPRTVSDYSHGRPHINDLAPHFEDPRG